MGKTLGYGEITVANVTEPFTVMLTNEAQQFATDSNRKVTSAQSTIQTLLLFVVVRSGLITQLEILLLAVGLLSVRAVKELHLV